MGVRQPQGRIRRYMNTLVIPSIVIERCLTDMLKQIQDLTPEYTEHNLLKYINSFLMNNEGYTNKKVTEVATSAPYYGVVLSEDIFEPNV